MRESGPDGAKHALIILDLPRPPEGLGETEAAATVRSALEGGPPCLWVHAAPGAGKTTAVASALEGASFAAANRVACSPGLRYEEALYRLSDFLRQAGIDDLWRALDQRSPLDGKTGVLVDIVALHPVAVWWDDFDRLEAGDGGNDARTDLLGRLAALPASSRGRFIFTAATPPPVGAGPLPLPLAALRPEESERLWKALAEHRAPGTRASLEGIPGSILENPLSLRLLAGMVAFESPHLPEGLRVPAPDLRRVTEAVMRRPGEDSLALLEALAAFPGPLRRSALREVLRDGGTAAQEANEGAETEERDAVDEFRDPRLLELEGYGLVEIDSNHGAGTCARIHPAVRDTVEERTRARRRERWQELLGAAGLHYVRLGSRAGDVWQFYRAWRLFWAAGRFREACHLTKAFIEPLLRYGYFDLALEVTSRTAETSAGPPRAVALGNLAIIHKNRGAWEEALAIYERARKELEALDDRPNLARVLHQIGNTRYLKEDFEQALESYRESLAISRELGEPTVAAATEVQIANVLWRTGQRDEAFRIYEETVDRLQGTSNSGLVAAVRLQIGQAHVLARRWVEAESSFRDAADKSRESNDHRSLVKALRAQAVVARERREYEQALGYCRDAERTAQELGDPLEVLSCQVHRGDLERDRTQLARALHAYLDAADTAGALETGGFRSEDLAALRRAVEEKIERLAQGMGREAYARALESRGPREGERGD